MIKLKIKECLSCKQQKYIYAKKMCKYCYMKQSKPSKIKPFSNKRKEQLDLYAKLSKEHLKNNPTCEVKECNNKSTNLHHKKGRTGKLLTDTRYFMACCSECHPAKIHETHVQWAYDNGYLLKRTL